MRTRTGLVKDGIESLGGSMQRIRMFQVDAFAERRFGGNPAAVCLLDDGRFTDATLQSIAAENNLSETAFVTRRPSETGRYHLRWFTPRAEVDLCGHATLATADVLFRQSPALTELGFDSHSGILIAKRLDDSGRRPSGPLRIQLDFPRLDRAPEPIDPALGARALGVPVVDAWRVEGKRDAVYLLDTESRVRTTQPDFGLLAELDTKGIVITAAGNDEEVDYVSRFFAPAYGIDEDPATGSAQCHLAPFWADRLGRSTLRSRQLSPRVGVFQVHVGTERVLLAGQTFLYLEGEIIVEDEG